MTTIVAAVAEEKKRFTPLGRSSKRHLFRGGKVKTSPVMCSAWLTRAAAEEKEGQKTSLV